VAMGAAGWYTFPDLQAPFPRGLRSRHQFRSLNLEPWRFLKVPMATFVGEFDTANDDSLKRSPRLDRQQGLTRLERAERWIHAMRAAAQSDGLNTNYQNHVLQNCAHSFTDCVKHGKLAEKATEFLFAPIKRHQTALSPKPVLAQQSYQIA